MSALPEVGLPVVGPRAWKFGFIARVASTFVGAVGTIVAASFVIFTALSFAPGDPVAQILGPKATDEARAAKAAELGLDDPLIERYWHWLTSLVHGDLGTSFTYREDVTKLVEPRLETTFLLVLMAALTMLVVGIALGSLGGISERWRPYVSAAAGLGVSVPTFVASSVLISVFAVQLGWFPTFGAGEGLADRIRHLVLPAIALSISYGAYVTQLSATAVRDEACKEHVMTSRGRGIPGNRIVFRHILRNAALPVMTASGLAIAGLVAGAVVVEQAFAIDGIGSLLIASISSKDYPVVLAVSLIIVIVFVVVMTIIDVAQVLLDPRQREGR
ncbi:ABC transporter permease [Aeromicrobium sp. Root344]|nr:ABC transporter permease [Aeromicrobium sp. Root344]